MQRTITEEELEAAVSAVQSLVAAQCGRPADSAEACLAACGIKASDDSQTLLSWRLYDAFFVVIEPEEIDPAASINDIALLACNRQPVNRWNETPMFLFHHLRKTLAAKHGKEPAAISWHTDFYEFLNAHRGRWSFLTDVDWAWDDLLTELETELGPDCELWDNLWGREPRWPFMLHVSTIGEMTNILWRFRYGGSDDPPLPRFPVQRPCDDALPDRVLETARQQVARLLADDLPLFRPAWRGQQGTTYQQWTFDDGDNPATPENIVNPYGTASADITVKDNGAGWQESLITAPDRTGVWVDLEGVSLAIDNSPAALPYKEVWVQVTYYEGSAHPPQVAIDGAQLLHTASEDVGPTDPMGNSWIVQHSRWRLEPNPSQEVITLVPSGQPFGMTIDQIVVDTMCFADVGMGDFDHDGDVDLADFNIFGQAFSGDDTSTYYPEADLDADNDCDLQDYVIFLSNFVGPQ